MNWYWDKDKIVVDKKEKQRLAMKQLQTEGKLPLSSSAIEARVKKNDQDEINAKLDAMVGKTLPSTATGSQLNPPLIAASLRDAVKQLASVSVAPKHFSMFTYAPYLEEPRKPLEPELTIVEPVTAWRRWSVEMFGNELRSNNGGRWTPYEKLTAECKAPNTTLYVNGNWGRATEQKTECKGIHCTCGIYAYKTPEDAKFGENAPANLSSGQVHIWGEVLLWGRVIEHSKGWRGQFAYPKSFVDSGIARQVAAVYGCKVIQDTFFKSVLKTTECGCPNSGRYLTHILPNGDKSLYCTYCGWREYIVTI